jgi:hypothetical protein
MPQQFGEESSTLLLIFYLFIGFCGFFLLILLLSMIFITLSEDDQIFANIITEDQEERNSEIEKDAQNCDKTIRVVKQSEQIPNGVLLKGKQMIIVFSELLKNVIKFPALLYFNFVQWTTQIDNDFIRIE